MKKIIALLMLVSLVFLTSCFNKQEDEVVTSEATEATAEDMESAIDATSVEDLTDVTPS